jgi:hypothetical protein
MPKPDSLRLKKEALQCETAAKLADFLESYVPHRCYDFTLPDLLSFKCDETLAELRKISTWQTLEHEFKAVGGWISEDWDELEPDEPALTHTQKPTPCEPTAKVPRWIDLILATIAVSVLLGASLGWFYPWLNFPVLSRPDDSPNLDALIEGRSPRGRK